MFTSHVRNSKLLLLAALAAFGMLAHTRAEALPYERIVQCQEKWRQSAKQATDGTIIVTAERYLSCGYVYGSPVDRPPVSGDSNPYSGRQTPDRTTIHDLSCDALASRRERLFASYGELLETREQLDRSLRATLDVHTAAQNALTTARTNALTAAERCDTLSDLDYQGARLAAHTKCKNKRGQARIDCWDEVIEATPYSTSTQQACTRATDAYVDQQRAESAEARLRALAAETWDQRAKAEREMIRVKAEYDRYVKEERSRCDNRNKRAE